MEYSGVEVIDHTPGPIWGNDIGKSYIIRRSGTYLGLLSFDCRLEAFEMAARYRQPLEIWFR